MSSTLTNAELRDTAGELASKLRSTDPAKHHRHIIPLIRIQESFAKDIREKSVVVVDASDPRLDEINNIATDMVREGIL